MIATTRATKTFYAVYYLCKGQQIWKRVNEKWNSPKSAKKFAKILVNIDRITDVVVHPIYTLPTGETITGNAILKADRKGVIFEEM